MERHDELRALIPFLANGTLAAEQCREVERHVEGCDDCRELLDVARRNAELAREATVDAALAHVAPPLLVQYADDPASLAPETRRFVEERLDDCADCRAALERLRELEAPLAAPSPEPAAAAARAGRLAGMWQRLTRTAPGTRAARAAEPEPRPGPLAGLWRMMARTVLHPAPALAYLLLLAALPLFLQKERTPLLPPSVAVGSDRTLRGEGEETAPIELHRGTGPTLLLARLELGQRDLDALEGIAVTLTDDEGRPLTRDERDASDLVAGEEVTLVPVLLDPARWPQVDALTLTVRARAPGSPLDGAPLFRRTIRILP